MSCQIRSAEEADIPVIRSLAIEIWPKVYGQMISPEQIEFMLEWMYSPSALQDQMSTGHHFLITEALPETEPIGFASYRCTDTVNWKLEKLYIRVEYQGKGIGRSLLEQVMKEIGGKGGLHLELQVNRNNPAVHFYRKMGFEVTRNEDFDIGHGFFMNDHIMARTIG
jgi:ribosomal protein S18 acetylase RimI-like enzyme